MAHMEHIIELDQRGWMLIHPLWCPGNLLKCPATQLARQYDHAPKTGRFWCHFEPVKGNYVLKISNEEVPRHVQGTSRRTGYSYQRVTPRPE